MAYTGAACCSKVVLERTFGQVAIPLAKEVPQRATAGHSDQQPYGRPENGHRSVTYQHFVGPAPSVLKCAQKGSWDLFTGNSTLVLYLY